MHLCALGDLCEMSFLRAYLCLFVPLCGFSFVSFVFFVVCSHSLRVFFAVFASWRFNCFSSGPVWFQLRLLGSDSIQL